jgi:hypothetical protein
MIIFFNENARDIPCSFFHPLQIQILHLSDISRHQADAAIRTWPGNQETNLSNNCDIRLFVIPVSVALSDQEYYSPWMGCWSITGYLPSYYWYPFILLGQREANRGKCLAQGH